MAVKKAKVGEYVKVIKKLPYQDQMNVELGDVGVVNYVASTGKYSVHIDGKKNPHDDSSQRPRSCGQKYDFWIPFECCEVVDSEELTKECLFVSADALDTYIGTLDNKVHLTISNDVNTWSVGTYKGNDCVMPSYARLKESEENKMKEIKNQKVVDLYFKRKKEEIDKKHKETTSAIVEIDRNQIFAAKLKKEYEEYVEENKADFNIDVKRCIIELPLTEETSSRMEDIDNQTREEISKLDELKEEIIALLSGCDTYEQEMEILRNYDIVTLGHKLA